MAYVTNDRGTIAERLHAGLAEQPTPTGCVEWMKSTTNQGYGRIWGNGLMLLTHRVTWELTNGPIPDGMFVCHKCDNTSCCNIEHLFLGTPKDNTTDMLAKGRRQMAFTHCPKGHEYAGANLYVAPGSNNRKCRTCRDASARTRIRHRSQVVTS